MSPQLPPGHLALDGPSSCVAARVSLDASWRGVAWVCRSRSRDTGSGERSNHDTTRWSVSSSGAAGGAFGRTRGGLPPGCSITRTPAGPTQGRSAASTSGSPAAPPQGRDAGRLPRQAPRPGPGTRERCAGGGRGVLPRPPRRRAQSGRGETDGPDPRRLPADRRQSGPGGRRDRLGRRTSPPSSPPPHQPRAASPRRSPSIAAASMR